MDWKRFLKRRGQKKVEPIKTLAGTLCLEWPRSNIPPEKPILWLRNAEGCMIYLETESSRIVPLFLTSEAAKVVALALKKHFDFPFEIRKATGMSRSKFEQSLHESNEFPPWNGEYVFLWEDADDFLPFLCNLKITILMQ